MRAPERRSGRAWKVKQAESATGVRNGSPSLLLFVLVLVVVGMVLAAHWPALSARALFFDDDQYLTDNLLVQQPGWASTTRFLTEVFEPSTVRGYYQPLAMISLMLDYAMGGRADDPSIFHRTSLFLHVVNTAMVIVLIYALFGRLWVAALAGLLFGVHPMTVEVIPWVGERKTLLATFFALFCLLVYVRYTRTQGRWLYVTCLALYVLALMSKPTSTPIPVVMLLMDVWPLQRFSRKSVLEKVPFFTIGAISGVVTMVSQARTARLDVGNTQPISHVPLVLCHNIVFYLQKIIWPTRLTPYYGYPQPLALSHPGVLKGVVGTCMLVPALIVSLRWTRALLVGWLIFLVAIFPTLGVLGFTVVIASDKYAYLPAIGFLLVLGWVLNWAWSAGPENRQRMQRIAIFVVVFAVACAFMTCTWRQSQRWQSTLGLYDYVLSLAPGDPFLYNNRGTAYTRMGDYKSALKDYSTAINLKPDSAEAYNNRCTTCAQLGDPGGAMRDCTRAVELNPKYAEAFYNRGMVHEQGGNLPQAIHDYSEAIHLRPEYAEAYNNRGIAQGKSGLFPEAIQDCGMAIQLRPGYAEAYQNRAMAYFFLQQYDRAWEDVRTCRRLGREPNPNIIALLEKATGRTQ
jgi:protein O-mannosyl-transferase